MADNFSYIGAEGKAKTGELRLEDYALADRYNLKVSQLLNEKYSDADPRFGTAFQQGARSLGIYTKPDPKYGILPTTVKDILSGECMHRMSAVQMASSPSGGGIIVSPGGNQGPNSTPASRLWFPETVMDLAMENLRGDWSQEMSTFNSMLAMDQTIATEMFVQPYINTSAPEAVRSAPIGQNALPKNMISLTSSQTAKTITTNSIGLSISDQAMANTTIDLVGIIVASQMYGENLASLWENLSSIVAGNIDAGTTAMTPVDGTVYDSDMTGGVITHKGFLKMLNRPDRAMQYDCIIGTLDDLLAIQGRTGRPLMFDPTTSGMNMGNAGSYGLTQEVSVANFSNPTPIFLIVPDGLWAAQHLLTFSKSRFLARVRNSSANYAAVEAFVLQRTTNWRWDFGEMVYVLNADSGKLVDYS